MTLTYQTIAQNKPTKPALYVIATDEKGRIENGYGATEEECRANAAKRHESRAPSTPPPDPQSDLFPLSNGDGK